MEYENSFVSVNSILRGYPLKIQYAECGTTGYFSRKDRGLQIPVGK